MGDALLFALIILFTVLSFRNGVSGESILITADGKEYLYPADEERTVSVEGPLGITEIEIRGGTARITDSPCPQKTCMTKSIGNTVTCLPNRVMIVNPEKEREEADTVAY